MHAELSLAALKVFLLYSTLLSYGFLLLWFGLFLFAHDAIYRLHNRWFQLSPRDFDRLHYGGMALFKIGVLLFFLIPWLSLCLLR